MISLLVGVTSDRVFDRSCKNVSIVRKSRSERWAIVKSVTNNEITSANQLTSWSSQNYSPWFSFRLLQAILEYFLILPVLQNALFLIWKIDIFGNTLQVSFRDIYGHFLSLDLLFDFYWCRFLRGISFCWRCCCCWSFRWFCMLWLLNFAGVAHIVPVIESCWRIHGKHVIDSNVFKSKNDKKKINVEPGLLKYSCVHVELANLLRIHNFRKFHYRLDFVCLVRLLIIYLW